MDLDLINRLKQGRVPSAGAAAPTANLAPAVRTATAQSASVDLQGFHAALAVLQVGTFGDTQSGSVYIEGELQESSDNSTWAAVPDASLLFPPGDTQRTGTATGTFFQSKTTGANDLAGTYTVGYRGIKRYIRVQLRLTGTHSVGTPTAVVLTAGHPDYNPTVGNAT